MKIVNSVWYSSNGNMLQGAGLKQISNILAFIFGASGSRGKIKTIMKILIVNYVNYCIFCSLLLNVHHLYIILSILRCFRHPNFLRFAKCWLFCEVGQINMYMHPSFLCIRPSEYRKISCLKTNLYTVFFYIKNCHSIIL